MLLIVNEVIDLFKKWLETKPESTPISIIPKLFLEKSLASLTPQLRD